MMECGLNNWFSVLKESRQITDSKTNVNLITEPIVMEGEDKFPCCEEAREKALQVINFREKTFVKEANCEDLYWKIHNLGIKEHRGADLLNIKVTSMPFKEITDDWQECVHSLNDEHIEQEGWFNDYRDVE